MIGVDVVLTKIVEELVKFVMGWAPKKSNSSQETATALRGLFSALQDCHEAYERYVSDARYLELCAENKANGSYSDIAMALKAELEPLREMYREKIELLAGEIFKLKDIIKIFDSDLYSKLHRYTENEEGFYRSEIDEFDQRTRQYSNRVVKETEQEEAAPFADLTTFIQAHTKLIDHF